MPTDTNITPYIYKYNFNTDKETKYRSYAALENIHIEKLLYWKWESDSYTGLFYQNQNNTYKLKSFDSCIGTFKSKLYYARFSPAGDRILFFDYYTGPGDIGKICIFSQKGDQTHCFEGYAPAFNYNGKELAYFIKEKNSWALKVLDLETNSIKKSIEIKNDLSINRNINCSVW